MDMTMSSATPSRVEVVTVILPFLQGSQMWQRYAAKASSIKKCEANDLGASSCEGKAIDKIGKKLGGAAKTSFMKKCVADFQAGK